MKALLPKRPGLLVSVRSADEALAALAGGADLIDVKEPTRGPLGRADARAIAEVVGAVAGRVPVSAALGEWVDWDHTPIPAGVAFVKWGLAGLKESAERGAAQIWANAQPAWPVLVAYADYERAGSPPPEFLAELASKLRFSAYLLDTAIKDGAALLAWIAEATLCRIRFGLGQAGVQLALAGSLDTNSICTLAPIDPDWFAVRGAACDGGREGRISTDRVRAIKKVISEASTARGEG
jgi:(5-formylfuran-3-yl)methyl phosphate synthase